MCYYLHAFHLHVNTAKMCFKTKTDNDCVWVCVHFISLQEPNIPTKIGIYDSFDLEEKFSWS